MLRRGGRVWRGGGAVCMEIDQCAATVRPAQAFEVVLFNTPAAFVLGNCLNDLSGVRGHATTELIQGLPNNLTECPHLFKPPPHTNTPPTSIVYSVFISPSGGGVVVCLLFERVARVLSGFRHMPNPPTGFSPAIDMEMSPSSICKSGWNN